MDALTRSSRLYNQTESPHDCLILPYWVSEIPHFPSLVLQIQMIVVFFVTQLLHQLLFKHIGMPPLVSQLFAGLALGPSGWGTYKALHDVIFPKSSFPVLKCITMLAYTLSLFIIAAKMDFTLIKRTGKKTIMIGLLSLLSSLAATIVTHQFLSLDPTIAGDVGVATTSLPVTSHTVLVRLLTDIGLVNSELGRLALASGLCVELGSITLTMIMKTVIPAIGDLGKLLNASLSLLGVVGLFVTIVFILRPFLNMLIKLTPKDRPIKDTYVLFAFLAMLIGALFTDFVGQLVLLGAFLVGCGLPAGPPLGSALVDKFDSLISGVLYPFCITTIAMRINLHSINFHGTLVYDLGILIFISSFTKVAVCFICGLSNNMAFQDALALATLMCAKGFLEMGTLSWLKDLKMISTECFSILAINVILTAVLVPFVLKLLYDPMRKYGGYQVRDIMHLKPNASLIMVACVVRSDNISSITNLLRILSPTKNTPIIANVLHLMKLAGQSQPLFISHDMQKKQSSDRSYSDEVIWHFNRLQQYNNDVLSTHVFTALSYSYAMHEYICTLALDKVVSLIVLPFHRTFSIDGSINIDDHNQRILNTNVLERSPCSVAVLVDRAHVNFKGSGARSIPITMGSPLIEVVSTKTESLISVAMIFIGGYDDMEALSLAKRMNNGMRVKLTVIRLAVPNDEEQFLKSLDYMAIDKLLDTKLEAGNKIMYVEITVNNGMDTALKLRSMVNDYDLMIVGRRFGLDSPQTTGLSLSTEIKELGILGDLLAAHDLKCRTSVLVVQQQQHWT